MYPAHAILIADVVEGTNVRMVQRGHGTRFMFEAGAQIRTLGDVLGQNFYDDGAFEACVELREPPDTIHSRCTGTGRRSRTEMRRFET